MTFYTSSIDFPYLKFKLPNLFWWIKLCRIQALDRYCILNKKAFFLGGGVQGGGIKGRARSLTVLYPPYFKPIFPTPVHIHGSNGVMSERWASITLGPTKKLTKFIWTEILVVLWLFLDFGNFLGPETTIYFP